MKKHLLAPVLLIQAIALLSFAPIDNDDDPTNDQIITCSDGTIIIPSGVNMSPTDQRAIVNILDDYGNDYGYMVYQTTSSTTATYNSSIDAQDLTSLDYEYGTDLGDGTPGTGYLYYKAYICYTLIVYEKIMTTPDIADIQDRIEPILENYGYGQ